MLVKNIVEKSRIFIKFFSKLKNAEDKLIMEIVKTSSRYFICLANCAGVLQLLNLLVIIY